MAQTWSIEAFAEEIGGGFIGNIIHITFIKFSESKGLYT